MTTLDARALAHEILGVCDGIVTPGTPLSGHTHKCNMSTAILQSALRTARKEALEKVEALLNEHINTEERIGAFAAKLHALKDRT